VSSIRSRMPTVAAIFDEFAAQFPGTKLLYGKQGAEEIDRREPVNPDCVFDIPANYHPMRQIERKERK
jgi:hypothetical protein